MIKFGRQIEHGVHIRHITDIPSRYILVECGLSEQFSHVRDKLGAPSANRPSPCLTHGASGGSRTLLVGIVRNGTFERGLVGKAWFRCSSGGSMLDCGRRCQQESNSCQEEGRQRRDRLTRRAATLMDDNGGIIGRSGHDWWMMSSGVVDDDGC